MSSFIKLRFPCCVCKDEHSYRNIVNDNYVVLPDKDYICHTCYSKELEKLDELVRTHATNCNCSYSHAEEDWEKYMTQLEKLKGWMY